MKGENFWKHIAEKNLPIAIIAVVIIAIFAFDYQQEMVSFVKIVIGVLVIVLLYLVSQEVIDHQVSKRVADFKNTADHLREQLEEEKRK